MKFEKRNAYVCDKCRFVTLTVHIHEGVTPFLLGCKNPQKCDGIATSFGYQMPGILMLKHPDGKLEPTHEWYKPDPGSEKKLDGWELDHVKNGGLLIRERTDAEPLYNEIKKAK